MGKPTSITKCRLNSLKSKNINMPKKNDIITINYFSSRDFTLKQETCTGKVACISPGMHYLLLRDSKHLYLFNNPDKFDIDKKEYRKLTMTIETLLRLHNLTEVIL